MQTALTVEASGDHEMVFMMGLPGAGKTTAREHFFFGHNSIDADEIKKGLPGYDPKRTTLVHEESLRLAKVEFYAALKVGTGQWVMDGTGTNVEKMAAGMRSARAAGFVVRLMFVQCSLACSIERNAGRERQVPVEVITEKAETIWTAFDLIKGWADIVDEIDTEKTPII